MSGSAEPTFEITTMPTLAKLCLSVKKSGGKSMLYLGIAVSNMRLRSTEDLWFGHISGGGSRPCEQIFSINIDVMSINIDEPANDAQLPIKILRLATLQA